MRHPDGSENKGMYGPFETTKSGPRKPGQVLGFVATRWRDLLTEVSTTGANDYYAAKHKPRDNEVMMQTGDLLVYRSSIGDGLGYQWHRASKGSRHGFHGPYDGHGVLLTDRPFHGFHEDYQEAHRYNARVVEVKNFLSGLGPKPAMIGKVLDPERLERSRDEIRRGEFVVINPVVTEARIEDDKQFVKDGPPRATPGVGGAFDGSVIVGPAQQTKKIDLGNGKDAKTTVNATGGKQSALAARFDLIPAEALFSIGQVLRAGAEKYGENNWHKISTQEHLDHALNHAYAWLAGDRDEGHLSHFACRALFALWKEIHNQGTLEV